MSANNEETNKAPTSNGDTYSPENTSYQTNPHSGLDYASGFQGYYPAFPPQPPLPVTAAPFYPADPYMAAAAAAYASGNSPALPSSALSGQQQQPSPPYNSSEQPQYLSAQPHGGNAISPFASPYLGPASNAASPFLAPYGYPPHMFYGYHSQQPSPFLQPVGMNMGVSPNLGPMQAPTSPNMTGRVSPTPTWGNVTTSKGAYELFVSNLSGNHLTTNVYVRGLPPTISDEALIQLCSPFGNIVSSKSIIDVKTGECKGYGFVMYATEDQARNSIQQLNALGYQTSFAKESFSTRLKNLQDPTSTNIYLSNLPLDMDETKLEELFKPYKIVSTRVLRDNNNVSRGVGFARMIDRESALAIIQKFNGFILPGSSVPLQVRFADSMAQKKLKSQTQRKRVWRAQESLYSPIDDDGSSTPQVGPTFAVPHNHQVMPGMFYSAGGGGYAPPNFHGMTGYSPYMQPQMLAGNPYNPNFAFAPNAQPPALNLPEVNGLEMNSGREGEVESAN